MIRLILALLLLIGASAAARAAASRDQPPVPPPSPSAACAAAIAATERGLGIAHGLLPAIGLVESGHGSGPWPWTIDVGGDDHFFATKAEAIAAVQVLQAHGIRSIDVGCVQVNLLHHPDAFASLDEAFDPATNVAYGGRFLRALYLEIGNWPDAAAAYHSRTPDLAAPYLQRVLTLWPAGRALGGLIASRPVAGAAGVKRVAMIAGGAGAAVAGEPPPHSFAYRCCGRPKPTAPGAPR